MFLLPPKSPRGPPWNKGHRPRVRHETSVFEVPAQEQHGHSFTLVLLICLLDVLCTRYAGIAHHWALQTSGRGWADSKAVHGMECSGVCSLYWRSLSAGAAAWSVPYCQYREVCSPTRPNANKPTNYQQRTHSRSCARVVYIAGDTLRHQPMGAGHMTVLQLRGPMAFRVPQWCHPMLARNKEDKLLYPDDHLIWCSKVDSGPRTTIDRPRNNPNIPPMSATRDGN